jgi:tetratricopeptide (TPR) repeat protein
MAVLAIALVALLSAGTDKEPAAPRATAKAKATPTAAQETPAAQATPTAAATTEAPPAPAGGTLSAARKLHNQGFAANNAGDFTRAISVEQQALEICKQADEQPLDPCGYALFELGRGLNGSGNPQAAIAVLEARLDRYGDNTAGDVQRELDAARAASGGRPGKSRKARKNKDKGD